MNTAEKKIVVSIHGYTKATRSGHAKLNGYRNKSKEYSKEMKRNWAKAGFFFHLTSKFEFSRVRQEIRLSMEFESMFITSFFVIHQSWLSLIRTFWKVKPGNWKKWSLIANQVIGEMIIMCKSHVKMNVHLTIFYFSFCQILIWKFNEEMACNEAVINNETWTQDYVLRKINNNKRKKRWTVSRTCFANLDAGFNPNQRPYTSV